MATKDDPVHSVASFIISSSLGYLLGCYKLQGTFYMMVGYSQRDLQYMSQPDNMRFHEQSCKSYFISL